MPAVLLATCATLPVGDEDGALLAGALAERGVDAGWAAWTDASVDWSAGLVVLRSTWDYTADREGFLDWVALRAQPRQRRRRGRLELRQGLPAGSAAGRSAGRPDDVPRPSPTAAVRRRRLRRQRFCRQWVRRRRTGRQAVGRRGIAWCRPVPGRSAGRGARTRREVARGGTNGAGPALPGRRRRRRGDRTHVRGRPVQPRDSEGSDARAGYGSSRGSELPLRRGEHPDAGCRSPTSSPSVRP